MYVCVFPCFGCVVLGEDGLWSETNLNFLPGSDTKSLWDPHFTSLTHL